MALPTVEEYRRQQEELQRWIEEQGLAPPAPPETPRIPQREPYYLRGHPSPLEYQPPEPTHWYTPITETFRISGAPAYLAATEQLEAIPRRERTLRGGVLRPTISPAEIKKQQEELPFMEQMLYETLSPVGIASMLPVGGPALRAAGALSKLGKAGQVAALPLRGIAAAEALPGTIISKVAKKAAKPKAGFRIPINMHTPEEVLGAGYRDDTFRRIAEALDRPGLRKLVDIANPSALATDDVSKGLYLHSDRLITGANIINGRMVELEALGDPIKIWGVRRIGGAPIIQSGPLKGKALGDVIEHFGELGIAEHLTPLQRQYAETFKAFMNDFAEWGARMGVTVPKLPELEGDLTQHVYRMVTGVAEVKPRVPVGRRRLGGKVPMEKTRPYATQLEGIADGVLYEPNLNTVARNQAGQWVKLVADKQTKDYFALKGLLGKTPGQRMATFYSDIVEDMTEASRAWKAFKDVDNKIVKLLRADVPGKLSITEIEKIGRDFPEIAGMLHDSFKPRAIVKAPGEAAIKKALTNKSVADYLDRALSYERAIAAKDFNRASIFADELELMASRLTSSQAGRIQAIMIDTDNAARLLGRPELKSVADALAKAESDAVVANIRALPKLELIANRPSKKALREVQSLLRRESAPRRAELKSAQKAYKGAMEQARQPSLTRNEATIRHPMFQGKIVSREVADVVNKYYEDVGAEWLRVVSNIAGTLRLSTAALDISAPFIQGTPVLGRRPDIWARTYLRQLKNVVTPRGTAQWSLEHLPSITEMTQHGVYYGPWEYVEALGSIQRTIARQGGRVSATGAAAFDRVIGETYGRLANVFSAWGNETRVLLWESMSKNPKWAGHLDDLAQYINKLTGVTEPGRLGISATHSQIENAFGWFAPRYTRAGISFAADLLKGGMVGGEARRSLAQFLAGGALAYYGTCKALGQTPNFGFDLKTGHFTPSGAFSIKIGENMFGIGSFMYGAMRLAADMAASIASEGENSPLDLTKLSRFDNPFIKWWFSRTSAVTRGIGQMGGLLVGEENFALIKPWTWLEGAGQARDWMGASLESPMEYVREAAKSIMPISTQQFIEPGGKPTLGTVGAELMGLRTYPVSPAAERRDLREEYAQALGKTWRELDILERRELEAEHPELVALNAESEARQAKMARGDQVRFVEFRTQSRQLDLDKAKEQEQIQAQYDAGEITGWDLNERIKDVGKKYAAKQDLLNTQYVDVIERFDEWRKESWADMEKQGLDVPLLNKAFQEYADLLWKGDLEDEWGEFDYKEYKKRQDAWRAKYGELMFQKVQQVLSETEPPIFKEKRKTVEFLKPYWEMGNAIWAQRPGLRRTMDRIEAYERKGEIDKAKILRQQNPSIGQVERIIQAKKQAFLLTNKEARRLYDLFYRR